jgi:hypothetical protein
MDEQGAGTRSAFQAIRAIDYTVIFARDMDAMRHFYETLLGFSLQRVLSSGWIEFRIGSNTLALAMPSAHRVGSSDPGWQCSTSARLQGFRGGGRCVCRGISAKRYQPRVTADRSGLWTSHAVLSRSRREFAGGVR